MAVSVVAVIDSAFLQTQNLISLFVSSCEYNCFKNVTTKFYTSKYAVHDAISCGQCTCYRSHLLENNVKFGVGVFEVSCTGVQIAVVGYIQEG